MQGVDSKIEHSKGTKLPKSCRRLLTPLEQLLGFFLIFIGLFSLGRLGLYVLYLERMGDSGLSWWVPFVVGLRMDTISAASILVIPTLLLLLAPRVFGTVVSTFVKIYFLGFFLLAIFIECATFPFLEEFDVRPNEIFINYLEYPKEVLGNIWAIYKLELFLTAVLLFVAAWIFWRFAGNRLIKTFDVSWWRRALMVIPMAILLFLGIRSTLGHRAANLSTAFSSSSRLLSEISKNSLHSLAYAVYSQQRHGGTAQKYGKMTLDEAYDRVSTRLRIPVGDREFPFSRVQVSHFPSARPKNLIIFLQESLGAQFVEAIGGLPGITPNLNRLAGEGLLFSNLFSNGTRSIRGIAGCTAGNLPVPGKGVLKRNKSQKDFFTVGSLLGKYGYTSSFIYGGASNFDNMKSWFLGNGFDRVIDEPEFTNAEFHGIWGVSDEDLVKRAVEEFTRYHQQGQPFASVLFSTTNHTPFEYPDGRIELLPDYAPDSPENAIKFADYAIGLLVDEAKRVGFFEDSVIVIVADHNVRVYGDDLVPVNMFRVPAVIVGGGIEPERIESLQTQPDVLATALDLLGLDLRYPILGKSVFEDREKDIALMKFHDSFALRHGETVAVVQPRAQPQTFTYENERLIERAHDPELEKDALAFVIVLDDLYQNRLFRQNRPSEPVSSAGG